MISVVIPAFNEEKRLFNTIKSIIKYFTSNRLKYEVIVVDDGSNDNTARIVENISDKNSNVKLISNKKNQGKGYSVKKGMLNADGDLILFMDADNSTKISELDEFLKYTNDFPIIIGSRKIRGAIIKTRQPIYRRISGNIFPYIVNLLVLRRIKDTQCGFKLFRKDVAKVLFSKQRLMGFAFDAEILYIAKKYGYRVNEMPIVWDNDTKSKLKVVRDPIRMFIGLIRIIIGDLLGNYN